MYLGWDLRVDPRTVSAWKIGDDREQRSHTRRSHSSLFTKKSNEKIARGMHHHAPSLKYPSTKAMFRMFSHHVQYTERQKAWQSHVHMLDDLLNISIAWPSNFHFLVRTQQKAHSRSVSVSSFVRPSATTFPTHQSKTAHKVFT